MSGAGVDSSLVAVPWRGPETFVHSVGELRCVYLGVLESGALCWPVAAVSGLVYHHTPERWRALAIMERGWSLDEVLVGRSHGDGVYCRAAYTAPAGRGVVVVASLLAAPLLDMSAGDDYGIFTRALPKNAVRRTLLDLGVVGILCSWGAVIYDPHWAVVQGYYYR